MSQYSINIKRVYEPYSKSDGFSILVDRLWPRGIRKEDERINLWLKEVAPSAELRKWFNHEAEKWSAFTKKYRAELKGSPALAALIALVKKHRKVTLLYGAKDEEHNQAAALAHMLHSLI
ncbi:MAG: DUF488 domain-containing protein [Sphingobacteriales bacterium]|nr:DUF488 domain-containing protein [Sphingobacteriales bacterium]OJW31850.1 MAG: hypothetical protein BGO54_15560 [Sphingobacteriales bacterium 46-32]